MDKYQDVANTGIKVTNIHIRIHAYIYEQVSKEYLNEFLITINVRYLQ